ncbi:hypothetical protein BD309DRAFT_990089 [Dichomitus squalens]|uniref:Aminoglycoside phosphotransferase domain-containing protein n=1 Tax=Dichomitus squalens TaxID=114155 RepID=A0A4Q9PRA1_9APHY|nr:hypothetical protein BD309DRAFT_990089 [Dichomitus squalens]TBU56907.1 hypothetical protein BD310DRAFT_881783 [Dichomitus squalens]
MFDVTPPHKVPITVYGGPSTGKKTLISLLNHRVYRCPWSGRRLSFAAELSTRQVDATVAFILVDARQPSSDIEEDTVAAARRVAQSICILHTKTDLVPGDHSNRHLGYLGSHPYLSYKWDVDCLSASLATGEGVDDILAYIGRIASESASVHQRDIRVSLQKLWSFVLDCIASCFALPPPTQLPDVSAELAAVTTDSDVMSLMHNVLDNTWGKELKSRLRAEDPSAHVTVNRITPSLIVKHPSPSERESMKFVRQNTTIPIPRDLCPDLSMLVMDFIDGEMLYECWDRLGRFMQFRVACTLRLYVKQLRSLTYSTPGALGDRLVSGILFEEYVYGPFRNARRFRRFCEYVAFEGWKAIARMAIGSGTVPPEPPRPSFPWTPVFTHGDLNMSNLVLDRRGTLWVMDWANAGFYPPILESIIMRQMHEIWHTDDIPPLWRRYRGFIAGKTSKEDEEFWDNFTGTIHRFPSQSSQRYT